MRKKDIKVGEEYAYRQHDWSPVDRVRVLEETDMPAGIWAAKATQPAWLIEMIDDGAGRNQAGKQFKVLSRQIVTPWGQHAAAQAEQDAIKARAERIESARLAKISREIGAVQSTMSALSVPADLRPVFNRSTGEATITAVQLNMLIHALR